MLSLRRATAACPRCSRGTLPFLSTLSLRRATPPRSCLRAPSHISIHALLAESDVKSFMRNGFFLISIHALLAESDPEGAGKRQPAQISIHALLAESDSCKANTNLVIFISIHALLAESDTRPTGLCALNTNFYPRSPCGERQCTP